MVNRTPQDPVVEKALATQTPTEREIEEPLNGVCEDASHEVCFKYDDFKKIWMYPMQETKKALSKAREEIERLDKINKAWFECAERNLLP